MELETMSAIADIITGLILLIVFLTLLLDLSRDEWKAKDNVMEIADREHLELLSALSRVESEIKKLRSKDWD